VSRQSVRCDFRSRRSLLCSASDRWGSFE
jgi:hypothetical protein